MVKSDQSDRYGSKLHKTFGVNFKLGNYWLLVRKYLGFIAYVSIIVGTSFLICCAFWLPDVRLWCKFGEYNNKARSIDSFLLLREKERASYDRLMRYILHPQAPCQTIQILGGKKGRNKKFDGDKVICLEPGPGLGEDCIVYSFGISNDWSFDESIHDKFGCQVYSFDPSMGIEDHDHTKDIHFFNMGVGEFDGKINVGDQMWNMRTLDTIIHQLGHKNRTIDVLKLDIEGAEYVVLEDILSKGLLNHVNHLCMEIHLPDNPYWTRVLKLLKRIEEEAGLRHFSTRNNTQTPLMRVPGFYARLEQHFFEMAWYRH
ncbi:probable methyltransferase-like protein 24 [Parasteatoda tepidariorum]|uniref:probable methyltransferase-like protein 24 n=1 Tax=Parasteatoda tepidariorum TaxID=114398 RepID=UPI00077FBBAB|nr:methyltransferase-like protein 24 [Parasteatoda tepidariorum]